MAAVVVGDTHSGALHPTIRPPPLELPAVRVSVEARGRGVGASLQPLVSSQSAAHLPRRSTSSTRARRSSSRSSHPEAVFQTRPPRSSHTEAVMQQQQQQKQLPYRSSRPHGQRVSQTPERQEAQWLWNTPCQSRRSCGGGHLATSTCMYGNTTHMQDLHDS